MSVHRLFAFTRLIVPALALGLVATVARAQDTSVVGTEGGGGVMVDLSVLDDLDRPPGGDGDGLRFPGSAVGPDEAVRLQPPGMPVLKPPTPKKKTRRTRPPPSLRPPAKPPVPAAAAVAEAEPGDAASTAGAPPRSVTEPPPAPRVSRSDVPPPPDDMAKPAAPAQAPQPADKRPATPRTAAVPPPPPPAAPDLPPIAPAPRADVDRTPLPKAPETAAAPEPAPAPEPPPAPAPSAAAPESQTAALPKDTGTFAVGATRAITFADGSAALPDGAEATLKAAAQALGTDPALRLQIKAYAKGAKDNESKARRLSLSRALGVRSVLIKEGVQPTRIDVRALGNQVSEGPADRVDVTVVAR